jgi:prefoldin subunit 5
MVPIGPLAFMPGYLIHTNEITVLLGESYFAERSADQASGIISRRKDFIQKLISRSENDERKLSAKVHTSDHIRQNLLDGLKQDAAEQNSDSQLDDDEEDGEDGEGEEIDEDDDEGLVGSICECHSCR